MKKIDKIRAVEFIPTFRAPDGTVYGEVVYDVRKLRRMPYADLRELLYEKTLRLYPFAIVDKILRWEDSYTEIVACIPVGLPLSDILRVSTEGDFSNA